MCMIFVWLVSYICRKANCVWFGFPYLSRKAKNLDYFFYCFIFLFFFLIFTMCSRWLSSCISHTEGYSQLYWYGIVILKGYHVLFILTMEAEPGSLEICSMSASSSSTSLVASLIAYLVIEKLAKNNHAIGSACPLYCNTSSTPKPTVITLPAL